MMRLRYSRDPLLNMSPTSMKHTFKSSITASRERLSSFHLSEAIIHLEEDTEGLDLPDDMS